MTAIRHPARARSQLYDSTHDGLARAVEPVALQVRCIHCHQRRCSCADCRCAAVTAIRHPARARSQLDSAHDGLARAVEPVALQVRCIHCHRRRCNCADRRALATCGGTVSAAASPLHLLPSTQVQLWYCHRRRCNCADCRCAAVNAIRHPASARSQPIRLTMGWHVLWSQWRCKSAAFTATDAGATAPIAAHSQPAEVLSVRLQVRCSHCHRRPIARCDCHTAPS